MSKVFGFHDIKDNNDCIPYTGLLNLSLLMWVVDKVMMCHVYHSVEDHLLLVLWSWDKVKGCHACLSVEDHTLLVCMKLRLGLLQEDFAHRFCLEWTIVSNVYRLWLPVLSKHMRALIVWPDGNSIRKHMSVCLRRKYTECICIINGSEIFIARPRNLTAVTVLSAGWAGQVSDNILKIPCFTKVNCM